MRKPITSISDEFMRALGRHCWPGNVRELQNCIERSVILSTGPVLNGPLPEVTGRLKLSAAVTLVESFKLSRRPGVWSVVRMAPPPGWACGGRR